MPSPGSPAPTPAGRCGPRRAPAGVVALGRELEVGEPRRLPQRALAHPRQHDAVLGLLLVDRAARVPELRVAVHRPAAIVGTSAAVVATGRIIASSSATKSPVRPRPPPPVRVLNRIRWPFLRMIASAPLPFGAFDPPLELRHALDQVQQPQEVRRVECLLVRRVDQQLLAEQEQAGELARLEDRALAVLARHDRRDLERRPLPVRALAERVEQDQLLPLVELEPASAARSIASSPAVST
jgi:hypothetical protein